MLEAPGRLWLNQARSDHHAASRLLDVADFGTYCQAIAKFQQVVEKSVKAIAAAARDVGIRAIGTGYSHEVDVIISALVRPSRGTGPTSIDHQIRGLLNESRRGEVRTLCALAPKRPGPGEAARRNTEYPFQRPDGSWIAPHEEGAFRLADVDRFRALANRLIEGSARIVAALDRPPRSST